LNITKPASIGKQTTYTYDGLGRLVSETTVDGSGTDVISYTYDSRGNRATMTENGIVTTYTYDANNRMTAEQTGLNVKTFTYDANGNQLVALYNFNPAGTYAYSLFGYQTSYTPDNVGYTYYTYRADGLRHSVGSTVHVWDGTNIVADVSGSTTTVYFRGIGLIYAETAGVQTYYHQNAHGDVIMLTDGMGNILKTYEYDAFGREWDALDTDNNPFRYCGEYFDKQTKTVYLRARYYDSAYGRFTQQDGWEYVNFGDPLSLNLYTYCWNNPGNLADPDGHFVSTLTGAFTGGLINGIFGAAKGQSFWKSAAIGAITGAIAGFGVDLATVTGGTGFVAAPICGALSCVVGDILTAVWIDGKTWDDIKDPEFVEKVLLDAGFGALFGTVAGGIGKGLAAAFGDEFTGTLIQKLCQLFDSETAEVLVSVIFGTSFSSIPLAATLEATGEIAEDKNVNIRLEDLPATPLREEKLNPEDNKPISHFYELFN